VGELYVLWKSHFGLSDPLEHINNLLLIYVSSFSMFVFPKQADDDDVVATV